MYFIKGGVSTRKIFKGVLGTALLMVVLSGRMAYAANECSLKVPFPPVNLAAITLGSSVPVGPVGEPKAVGAILVCSALSATYDWYIAPQETNPSLVGMTGESQLFKTNIEGVGISVTPVAGLNTTLAAPLSQTSIFFKIATGKLDTVSILYKVQYYKLSERTGKGSVSAMTIFNRMGT